MSATLLSARPAVWLRLHGAAHLRLPGGPVALERKHAALLAYLWLEGPTPRARLAGLLWPEASEERARGNLRQRLSKLRQLLGDADDIVRDERGVLSLLPGLGLEPADPPHAPLLDALDYDDCEAFARWLEGRREAERDRRKREWLAEVREAAQSMRLDDALFAADQLLQADRESEEAYRVLMEVFYLRGDHAAALSAWDRCRDMLRQLYGVQPSAATRELGHTILQAAQAAEAPAPAAQPQLPATVLRPPRLVARAAAMQALLQGWQRGDALCVAGEAGLGKSRLLADFVAQAGPCVLAAGRPGDTVLPYASLSRLVLAAVDRFKPALEAADAGVAARLLPRLAALLPPGTSPAGEGVRNDFERTQALLATARLLGQCVRGGCAGFVLDDLQFADPASVEALRVLAEPAEAGTPLRFVFATRPDETGAAATALLDSLAATGRWQRIELAPLSEVEAAELIGGLGLAGLDVPTLAGRVWRQVGGNPAFLLESLKLLLSMGAGADGSLTPLPASIESVIQRRIDMLTPRARHLAQLAAVAGTGYSVGLAAAALACPVIELSEPLRELELRQVFYGRQFVHDLIAAVVQRSVPASVAEFMHRFVAEYLSQQGSEPALIAGHWLACEAWREAGQCYVQAAAQAAAAARFHEQGELLDAAMACFERAPSAGDDLFDALLARIGAAEAREQPGLRAAQIPRLAALARSPMQRLQALAARLGWEADYTRTDVALDDARAAIPRALELARPDIALQLAEPLSWQLAMRGRLDEGLDVLQAHEHWATREADTRTRALFHRTRAGVFGFGDRLQSAIEEGGRALSVLCELEDWANALPAMSNLGLMHFWRGEFEAAREVLTEARALRERLNGRGTALTIDLHLGGVLRDLGDNEGALALLEPMRAFYAAGAPGDLDARSDRVLAENHLAQVWLALGQPGRARECLASDDAGVGVRFRGRRLALKLRIEREHGGTVEALRAQCLALLPQIDSPFAKVMMGLELAKLLPPVQAAIEYAVLHEDPASQQRPGLQLHAAACAAEALLDAGRADEAAAWVARAVQLRERCQVFDLAPAQAQRLLERIGA